MVSKVDRTPFKALSKPVVSPPISTVIPLILFATQIPPLLKSGIKNTWKLPSLQLKFIEVLLRGLLFVFHIIIGFFRPDIENKSDGQKVKISYGDADFYAPQEEQRRCHLPLTWAKFFLASTSATMFSPHSLRISGRIS